MRRVLIALLLLCLPCVVMLADQPVDLLTVRLVSHVRWQRAHAAEGQLLQQAVTKWQEETAALGKDRSALEADAKCAIDWNASPPACAPKAEDPQ